LGWVFILFKKDLAEGLSNINFNKIINNFIKIKNKQSFIFLLLAKKIKDY